MYINQERFEQAINDINRALKDFAESGLELAEKMVNLLWKNSGNVTQKRHRNAKKKLYLTALNIIALSRTQSRTVHINGCIGYR